MTTVLLVIHVMIAIALIAVVLLQRSEGGALGIGGGGGGFMTGRSAGNALTKTTAVLAAAFFATIEAAFSTGSISLSIRAAAASLMLPIRPDAVSPSCSSRSTAALLCSRRPEPVASAFSRT